MRRTTPILGILAVLALVACGDDGPAGGSGPFAVQFQTIRSASDTVTAMVTMDDTLTFTVRGDTVVTDVPGGLHRFTVQTTLDYLPFSFTQTISGGRQNVAIARPGTCRVLPQDAVFCLTRNAFWWPGHTLIVCPANEYGEICTAISDPDRLGLTWPDTAPDAANAYIGEGKLLIGALRDASAGGEDTLAMAFYQIGDYAPRQRLGPVGTDSTRWRVVLWTDVRHTPFFGFSAPRLTSDDRPGQNFGLQVSITAYLPPSEPNAILLKFDVTNISAMDEYRFFHPEQPVGGHTLRDVYLAPMFDFDIGSTGTLDRRLVPEIRDDNITMFPAESLLVAYDQGFQVPNFSPAFMGQPGLVGVQVVESPPGTEARGIFLSDTVGTGPLVLDYVPAAREDSTYAIYSAGRAGAQLLRPQCVVGPHALDCAPETGNDVKGGWSIGPIPAIGPGETVSLTVAIVLARPTPGTVSPATIIRPGNDSLTTTRQITPIAADLRARAATVRGLRVP
ncbi:MAG TPA: hypothetical protein VMM77_08340 [Gemmatimonadaceae bacterium]|nr:hypothetical protein [Gemmatimonadaceae bacterium]